MSFAFFFLVLFYFMNHKHEALWPSKEHKLYIMYRLILSNPLHLTIGTKVSLIQIEF